MIKIYLLETNNKNTKSYSKLMKCCFNQYKYSSYTDSQNVCCFATSNFPIGIDLEFIDSKNKNINVIKKRVFPNSEKMIKTKKDFYRWWTTYEAIFKLNTSDKFYIKHIEIKNFILSIASNKPIKNLKIKKLVF